MANLQSLTKTDPKRFHYFFKYYIRFAFLESSISEAITFFFTAQNTWSRPKLHEVVNDSKAKSVLKNAAWEKKFVMLRLKVGTLLLELPKGSLALHGESIQKSPLL